MGVGNCGAGVRNVIQDLGNDGVGIMMDVGDGGVGVRTIAMSIGNNAVGVCNIRNGCMCVCCKFSLKRKVSDGHAKVNRTYVEDLKNSGEVQSPSGDCLFIVLREESRDCTPFPPLDDLPLHLRHSPAIRGMVSHLQDASPLVSLTPSIAQSPGGRAD